MAIYLKNVSVIGWTGRQKIGHISTPETTILYLVAAGLIRAKVIISMIRRLELNSRIF